LEELVARLSLVIVPLYISNAGAVLLKGKTPLDLNKKFFDSRPLLGKGKTIKGTFLGLFLGLLSVYAIQFFFASYTVKLSNNYFFLGSLLVVGGILGDIAGSFIKRRAGLKRGAPVFLLDQLDFVAGGLIFSGLFLSLGLIEITVIVTLTIFAHKVSNLFAFRLHLKKVPW
jgi:CDP-2,3-bis-(O-geranylgeranyl)-sn-glycerol synthase